LYSLTLSFERNTCPALSHPFVFNHQNNIWCVFLLHFFVRHENTLGFLSVTLRPSSSLAPENFVFL
jgi:hypothetical protein